MNNERGVKKAPRNRPRTLKHARNIRASSCTRGKRRAARRITNQALGVPMTYRNVIVHSSRATLSDQKLLAVRRECTDLIYIHRVEMASRNASYIHDAPQSQCFCATSSPRDVSHPLAHALRYDIKTPIKQPSWTWKLICHWITPTRGLGESRPCVRTSM